MTDVRYEIVTAEYTGQRLDNYLMRLLKGVPKSHVYRIIRSGEVRVNRGRAAASTRVNEGDSIRIPPVRVSVGSEVVKVSASLQDVLEAAICFEDQHLLVLNKPAGIAVHGGSGISLGVVESLRQLRPLVPHLELAHRLDRDTSGCLVLAKKRSILKQLQAAFADRTVKKCYWALLAGTWRGLPSVTVDAKLEKNILQSGERMVRVSAQGKPSETHFSLIKNFSKACWVEVRPETGRTHQIRVHSAFLGHPVVGDDKYGTPGDARALQLKKRLYLHARSIQFTLGDKLYQFEAELDDAFKQAVGDA